jgi:hypothetical protein
MKEFFQGLVLGAVVMYGYVNQGVDFLGPFKDWFDGTKQKIENNPRKKEADKMTNGFFFPRDIEDGEKTARV